MPPEKGFKNPKTPSEEVPGSLREHIIASLLCLTPMARKPFSCSLEGLSRSLADEKDFRKSGGKQTT